MQNCQRLNRWHSLLYIIVWRISHWCWGQFARAWQQVVTPYLLEEGWVFSQVFGHHIETEKVAVDALSCHGQAVQVLVVVCCLFEQLEALFSLKWTGWKCQLKSIICIKNQWLRVATVVIRGVVVCCSLTVSSLIIARTKAQVSTVQERTVSVRPSRNKRVMEASYVRQNFFLSYWERQDGSAFCESYIYTDKWLNK